MNRGLGLAVVMLLFAGPGCASIQTTSQTLPGATPQFARVMVAAPLGDLSLRTDVETGLRRMGNRLGVDIIPYHEVFLIGRQYPVSEVLDELETRGVDAILFINDATQDPPTVVSRTTAVPMATGEVVARGVQYTRRTSFTIVSQLFDLADEEQAWLGSTRIEQNWEPLDALILGFAEELLNTLIEDGVLQPGSGAPSR